MPVIEPARLLKADVLAQRGQAVSFQYADIGQRCDDQLQAAQLRAEQILADAAEEVERLRQEAWQVGHATGALQAETEFDARVETEVQLRVRERLSYMVPALQSATKQLIDDREQILLQWETAAIRLSLTLAERIVRRELQIQPAAPRALIAEALQLTAGATSIVLRLHPDDAAELEADSTDWQQFANGASPVKVIADAGLTRGGCLVETPEGEIDGRIESQLSRLAEELLGYEFGE